MGPIMSLKYKAFIPVVLGVAGLGVLYQELTLKALEEDRAHHGMETAETVGQTLRDEMETLVKFRLEELSRLTSSLSPNYTDAQLFQTASSDFRSDILNVSVYQPTEDGRYALRFFTNRSLLKAKHLPPNSVFLMDQAAPVDITRLAKARDTAILNRSFEAEGEPVAVQSFVLFVKKLDGGLQGPIVIADALAKNVSERLRRSETIDAFLVNKQGTLLAHSNPEMMVEYRDAVFPGFPQSQLPSDWTKGSHVSWRFDAKEMLTMVTPTALKGVYLTAQVEKQEFTGLIAGLRKQAWLGVWAILGVLAVLTFWMMGRTARNVRNTAAAMQLVADGEFDRVPKIYGFDEFRLVVKAFKNLETALRARLRGEFERGQKESLLSTVQTLRSAMGTPTAASFAGWDVLAHRSDVITSQQEFWDFHDQGRKRQVIVGRSSVEGVTGVLLALLVRTTLDNTRRIAQRFSDKPPTLGELLDVVNGTLFSAFKGRAVLCASAFEVDLDTGALTWIHAGGPSAMRWKPEADSPVDDVTLGGKAAPVGSNAVSSYQATTTTLTPGERLLVRAQTPMPAGTKVDPARDAVKKALTAQGAAPIANLKNTLVAAMGTRVLAENLVFVALRRPAAGETSESIARAAA